MKITVIGAGNTGKAMAIFLTTKGYDVCLYDRKQDKVDLINKEGIKDSGSFNTECKVKASSDLKEAVSGSEMIFVTTTSDGHLDVAKNLRDLLEKDQSIVIFNGNWGAYEFYEVLKDKIEELNLGLAETGGMIFTSKYISEREVLAAKKESVDLGILNGNNTEKILNFFNDNMNNVTVFENLVAASLNASNPVIHVPIVAFNLARIEAGEDFAFYGPAASPLAIDYVLNIDKERLALCDKLGIKAKGILDIINGSWKIKHENLYDALHLNESYKLAKGPKNLHHRYVFEDIPYGIYPVKVLSNQMGLKTPYLDGIIGFMGKAVDWLNLEEEGVYNLDYKKVLNHVSGLDK
ncbi:NAD/NADP-dependent octopine/nopaline dehydrogenase family protein [Peptoniphilus catoniae]|uniref:NAD/NADP-dependent octopine/nopaline dehydrogenase family protein n=1 Tax=Peptoniphilus catoniae TaxID=1660341 RepID=UPI0010FF1568|nr:NAD/NADP-dependent octopine/nopaline dehydrogenase family protein [Peptoniphilus catoniae]